MRPNQVKQTVKTGSVSIGTMVCEFNTNGIALIAATAGADFVMFDMEHTGWSVETISRVIAAGRGADIVPLVRVPMAEYHFIARVLDAGAMGLMVPMVESEEQARLIVRCAKYPPQGRRGAAFGLTHDAYTQGNVIEKMMTANYEQLLIAQIETVQGLDNADRIAAVEGIDVLWIGHFDLSNSLGIPGQFDHPKFQIAIDHVVEVCRRYGKAPGYMASSVEEGRQLKARGFRCFAYGGDLWIYQQALRKGLADIRTSNP